MASTQPIFIFGFAHSGTSLLQIIFEAHGDIYKGMNETYFWEFPYLYTKRYPDLKNPFAVYGMLQFCANLMVKGYWQLFVRKSDTIDTNLIPEDDLDAIIESLPEDAGYTDYFRAACDWLARTHNKSAWVEKTPGHTFHITRILSEIPDAKGIALVRDPRDILASKKLRELRLKEKLRQGTIKEREIHQLGMVEYDPFWTSVSWRSSYQEIERAKERFADRLHVVRYEDLVDQPEANVRAICSFLGLEFQPVMLEVGLQNVATRDKVETVAGTGIVRDSLGRWRTSLTRGEIALANQLLGRELAISGYEIPPQSRLDRVAALFTLIASFPNLARRAFNKLRYQGKDYTIAAFKSYYKRIVRSS